jgi:hypothetical protein
LKKHGTEYCVVVIADAIPNSDSATKYRLPLGLLVDDTEMAFFSQQDSKVQYSLIIIIARTIIIIPAQTSIFPVVDCRFICSSGLISTTPTTEITLSNGT